MHAIDPSYLTSILTSRYLGFSESATSESLLAGDCTSCAVTQDMSAYWTPPLYFAHTNGTFELLTQKGGMLS